MISSHGGNENVDHCGQITALRKLVSRSLAGTHVGTAPCLSFEKRFPSRTTDILSLANPQSGNSQLRRLLDMRTTTLDPFTCARRRCGTFPGI